LFRAIKPVQAFVRVKPTGHFAQDMIKFGADNKSIDIHIPKDARGGFVNNSYTDWSFRMDGLLHNISQDQIYETVAKDLVAEALRGYNGTIMCYGQTGAGKTYTMTGATTEYKHRGIIPRAIQQVFKAAAESLSLFISVRISYLEIYNEALFDLLGRGLGRGSGDTPLAVMDSPRGIYVRGLSIRPVSHEEEALNLLFEAREPKDCLYSLHYFGETNRVIAEHALNKNSSRSHCIFTIYIECRPRVDPNLKGIKSKITLIDLAGSERLSKITSAGQIQKENSYINRSLTFLEQIILALADPRRGHIPFRQSKLTHVLKDSLGGNCNTVLVTNICGEAAHVGETLSSLRFATRMRWITAEPVPNVTFDREVSVKALEEKVLLLKQELGMQDMLADGSRGTSSPLTGAQRAAIKSQVHKYLRGAIEEIDIVSIRQIQEVFKQFKAIVSQQQEEVEAKLRSKYLLIDKGEFSAWAEPKPGFGSDFGGEVEDKEEEDKKEKEVMPGPESTLSLAPLLPKWELPQEKLMSPSLERDLDGSAPPETQEESPTKDVDEEEGTSEQDRTDSEKELSASSSGEESQQPSFSPSKAEAFELFKQKAGSEISRIFRENKSILLARKRSRNSVARRINDIKREMEGLRETLEGRKQKRWQEGEYTDEQGQVIIDEKEFSLILKLKELKEEHRAGYAELQDLKAEIQYCQQLVDKCRRRLILEFEIWYNESFLIPEDVGEALRPGGSIRPGLVPINRVMCLDEDEQDKFEQMQETNLPECPGSTPFYRAKMKTEQQQTFDRTMSSLQQMRRKPGIVTAAGKNKPLSFLHVT
ncbi:KIF9 protein, partial [Pachyramphus minor]|nr:KIF9 protein [Pachyramphus minor]